MSRGAYKQAISLLSVAVTLVMAIATARAQDIPNDPNRRFKVVDGVLTEIRPDTTALKETPLPEIPVQDTVAAADTLTRKEKRQLARELDAPATRYSRIFRDSIPISRMTAISLVAPGFGQLYNKQAWKIPILYGTVGATAYLGFKQNSKYRDFKGQYDYMQRRGATQEELDPVQSQMIKYNTRRTLLFVGAIASYIYFVGDAVVNYNGPVNSIKKATTLSTICPGAGQIYNKSYWKVPIVVGGFATMFYVIDYNARGYKRFKLAYDLLTDDDPNTVNEFNNETYTAEQLRSWKNAYRRNRDLCIIITAGVYLLNIIDAHVDAHMKDFDISDDLVMRLEPTLINFYTQRTHNVNGVGLSFKMNF